MFSNFKKYVQDVFPTKISEEQWKDILGEVKFNIITHTQLQYIGKGRRYGIWGGRKSRMVDIEVLKNYWITPTETINGKLNGGNSS